MRAKRGGGDPSPVPIFVVGMPRSGTTLVEQILASHPMVHGAGELKTMNDVVLTVRGPDGNTIPYPEFVPSLDAAAMKAIGARYVALLRELAPHGERVTDKMPSNYYFVGLIHLALPNARIVHTMRDPVDTCISCFSKLFTAEQNHTYDLGERGRPLEGVRGIPRAAAEGIAVAVRHARPCAGHPRLILPLLGQQRRGRPGPRRAKRRRSSNGYARP
jgi:hypothetical protein